MLAVPKTADLFPEKAEQDKIDRMRLQNSSTQIEQSSSFTAHAIKTQSMTEIRRGYIKVKQMFPAAAHIMAAYIFKSYEGHQDDGEHGASSKILQELSDQGDEHEHVCICGQRLRWTAHWTQEAQNHQRRGKGSHP